MNLMICIDDAGGMMFNHRRQSQDRVLRARMLEVAKASVLWVTPYTQRQFGEDASLRVCDVPWKEAGAGEYYFVEDGEIPMQDVEKVYLYRWNRLYPNDRVFAYDLEKEGFALISTQEFQGYSHECITEEIYVRRHDA